MIISSELTGERYDSVDECLKAEHEFRVKKEIEEQREREREERANELEQKIVEDFNEYCEVLNVSKDEVDNVLVSVMMDMLFGGKDE